MRAQTLELGHVFAVGQQPGFHFINALPEYFVFFAHGHKVEVAVPHVLGRVLDGAQGFEHGSGQLQPHFSGQVVQRARALVP